MPQNMYYLAHIGLTGSFCALLVGWLVVVAQGCNSQAIFLLYLVNRVIIPISKIRKMQQTD